jgi:hypothetical protein
MISRCSRRARVSLAGGRPTGHRLARHLFQDQKLHAGDRRVVGRLNPARLQAPRVDDEAFEN